MTQIEIVFAVFNKELFETFRNQSSRTVKSAPYLKNVIKIVDQAQPEVVVFSPHLDQRDGQPLGDAWKDVLYDLTMRDEPPRIIFLAGNEDKKGEIVRYALQCEVRDFVFNPPVQGDVTQHVCQDIMDHIENPRTRKQTYEELGIVSRKQMPTIQVDQFEELEQNRLQNQMVNQKTTTTNENPFGGFEQVQEPPPAPKPQRPTVIAVYSPASCGASTVAQNVATALAYEDFHTAIVDMDKKRSLHFMFNRDTKNQSFVKLFSNGVLEGERTHHSKLDAFTSGSSERFYGEPLWMDTVFELHHEVVVLDFSTGNGWRHENLLAALDRCDEILLVYDMDMTKAQHNRFLLEQLSQYSHVQIRLVLNKFIPEHMPCEVNDLLPIHPSYQIGFHPEVYKAIQKGFSLVDVKPEIRNQFLSKELQRGGLS